MNDTDNGTYSDDNDVENDAVADGNGGAMMSIFASYYGIEDDVKSKRPPGDLIDSAHFDSNAYVKVIYQTLSHSCLLFNLIMIND
jgi:hypothetical protein